MQGAEDIRRYRTWMEANRYPAFTIQTYTAMMAKFLRFVSPKEASQCTAEDLIRLIDEYILPNGLSQSFQNHFISSIKKFYRNLMKIRQAKGFKDRVVPISVKTIEMVDYYIEHFKPQKYLFAGQWPGDPYSVSSLEKVLKKACERAGIRKPVTLHWLRHSYATHLLESVTDLRYIQKLLGHQSSRTTEIYTHVRAEGIQNIRSPFDDL